MLASSGAALGLACVQSATSCLALASVLSPRKEEPIVTTTSGKIRGTADRQIAAFKAIPYARPKERGRFLPAEPAPEWVGIRSTMTYGAACPVVERQRYIFDHETAYLLEPRYDIPDEDCLNLNIWTPGIDSARRPVMVWLHGGGCSAWSAQYLACMDGGSLSRSEDIVVVSINHRLGPFGFLELVEFAGPDYAESGNIGMLDIVAALRWIQKNIAQFGGNPENVTIFGQSGGGTKVAALMTMPAARGLFHRAAIMSGSMRGAILAERAAEMSWLIVKELGLRKGQIQQLARISTNDLMAAGDSVWTKLVPPGRGVGGFWPKPKTFGWGPVVDGKVLPMLPFDPAAPPAAVNVPLILGTVLNECMPSFFTPAQELMSKEALHQQVVAACGARATELIDAYRSLFPRVKPVELLSIIHSAYVRRSAISWAERKAEQNVAPAYLYWFQWHTPVLDGRPRSFHCLDLPFAFANAVQSANMTGGGAEAGGLARTISAAFAGFARSGQPGNIRTTEWPAYQKEKPATMIFNTDCVLASDPDAKARQLFYEILRDHPTLGA